MKDIDVRIKHINIAVSISCNLKCKMCDYREPITHEEGLSKEDVFRLLRDARELGLENIAFSGGEVLLRKDIYEMVSYARELGIPEIAIVTNGTLVNEENAIRLVEAGMTSVNISLEGVEHINDYIRGEGTYKKAFEVKYYGLQNNLGFFLNKILELDCSFFLYCSLLSFLFLHL